MNKRYVAAMSVSYTPQVFSRTVVAVIELYAPITGRTVKWVMRRLRYEIFKVHSFALENISGTD